MTRQGGPAVGTVHCIEFAVLLPLRGRARLSAPLQWRVRSAILPGNLQLPMALATRKGHAASVRRQSRQRLRSERRYIFLSRSRRRYRRNRSVRFYRHLVRTGSAFPRLPRRFAPRNDTSGQRSNGNGAAHRIGGTTAASRTGGACSAPTGPVRIERRLVQIGSAFPRLPRPLWGLAMTRQGSAAMGTVRRTESAVLLPLRGRAWLSPPLQGQCGLNDGRRMIHSSFFSIHYSLFHPSPCGGWQTI